MKIKEFCKKHKISKSSIFKYFENKPLSFIIKNKIKKLNINKNNFDDYKEEYQKWYIFNNKDKFSAISKQSHISIPSWIKYIKGWNLSNQMKYKINKYIKEHNININNIFIDKEENIDEKEYHGNNYDIYSWNINDDKRRIQIEIKNQKSLVSNKKKLLEILKPYNIKVFAQLIQNDYKFGYIIDVNSSKEKDIITIIDKIYM